MADLTLARASLKLNVQRGYNEPYLIHQLVADLFGDREDRGYLFRTVSRAPREAGVLILSRDEPCRAPEREWGHVTRLDVRPFNPQINPDQVLDYEVRINATRTDTQPSGRKKRVDVWDAVLAENPETPRTPHAVYHEYLSRKLIDRAEVLECRVVERGMVKVARRNRAPLPHVATNLIGTLRVTDPAGFLDEIAQGIGRSKAFGCGLLCLSRPGSILPRRYPGPPIEA